MNPVRIELIEDSRWRVLWVLTLIFALGLLILTSVRAVHSHRLTQHEEIRRTALRAQIEQLYASAPTSADPRQFSIKLVAESMQLDLNKIFSTVENQQLPGVRLRSMHLDTTSYSLRLEYELDSITKAATMTEKLNAGYEARPWQLERINAKSTADNSFNGLQTTPLFVGVWSAHIARL